MAQFTLPANSKVKPGKNHGGADGATNVKKFAIYRYDPTTCWLHPTSPSS